MTLSPEEKPNPNPNYDPAGRSPEKRKRVNWPDQIWSFKEQQQALKNVVLKMRRQSLASAAATPPSETDETPSSVTQMGDLEDELLGINYTTQVSDGLLLHIFGMLPEYQHISNSLVCKRWSLLSGRLVQSIKLLDWEFLESGRLVYRFPNLTYIDLVRACIRHPRNSGILVNHRLVSVHIDSCLKAGGFVAREDLLHTNVIDEGVKILAEGCPNLRKLVLIGISEEGLSYLAEECHTLQELELHCCTDVALKGISGCQYLQILKLIGFVDGFYNSLITDIGLTNLAQGCRRLVKLELVGCQGSYDGIKAIGQCCQMLEELTLCDHRMDGGWLSALSYCENLKTLRLRSCKSIDSRPGPEEHLGSCPTLEELHLQQCQMRDKLGVRALFLVCEAVRDLVIEDCWGLDNTVFSTAAVCRQVRSLSMEGCSLLTTEGLDSIVVSWTDLKSLRVVSCNSIKDSEITPALATLFSVLKELKWRPDSRSLLSSGLVGTEVGQKHGRSLMGK